jgi:O-antigen/teichoic acid export membrane protein
MERGLKEQVIKNSFWAFASSLINRLGALIFTIILARFLLPEGFGLYSIVLSTAMIFYTFADLGINSTMIRYVSHALANNKKKVYAYHRYLLKVKFFLTLAVSSALLVLSYPLALYVFKNSALFVPFITAAFYIFVLSFDTFYTSFFYTIEKVQYVSFKESLSQILRIVFALVVFYVLASSYYVTGIFVSLALISLFLVVFVLYYLKKLIPEAFLYPGKGIRIDKVRILKFAGFLTIASISTIFFSYIDSIMLGMFLKPEFVGFYRAAFSLVSGVSGIILAPAVILLPMFTKLKKSKTENALSQIFKYLTIFAVPAAFGLLILGKYFVRFFYDYSYIPAALPLYFLSFLIIPVVYVSVFLPLFSAREKPQIFAKIIVAVSILNIILNYILIKALLPVSSIWATAGASIATLTSWIFYLIAVVYVSKKELGIAVSFKHLIKPFIASIIMSGAVLYTMTFFKDMTFISGTFEILLGALVYFGALFLIGGIKREDFELVKLLRRL